MLQLSTEVRRDYLSEAQGSEGTFMDEREFVGAPVRRSPGDVEESGMVHFRVKLCRFRS